jgi:hypothetical protein
MSDDLADVDPTDITALELAVEQTLRERSDWGMQISCKIAEEGWRQAAEFAASHRQTIALHLKPWQLPPSDVVESDAHDPLRAEAVRLLHKMLAHGVSRYDPNPLAAIAAAKKQKSVNV